MSLVKVDVVPDNEKIQEIINKHIGKNVKQSILFVDINRLEEITSMSKKFLEDEILTDPRVKAHERRKNRKRWWLYEPTIEAIKDITDEW